jgi:hypothetical protein
MYLLSMVAAITCTLAGEAGNDMTGNTNAAKVYEWMLRQQAATGILGNQENEYFSGLYTSAVASICYIHEADIARAERVFSFFNAHLDVAKAPPGGFPQFWDAGTGQPQLDTDRWIGDNAWLLIALNYHFYATGKDDFAEMRQIVAEWLISLQDADGGIKSGFNQDGLMYWKSTEGNLDCYAALTEYPRERHKVGQFLREKMWIPGEGRFRMGSTVSESALDGCSLGIAALGPDYAGALEYAETAFLCQQRSDATGNIVTGFCDFTTRDRIWLEGTGQMVVAYNAAGRKDSAQQYLRELDKAMMPSSRFAGTIGLPCHTNNPAWSTGSNTIFVPSQAWYLFGVWKFNPMNYNCPQVVDFNKDGKIDLKDFSKLAQYWYQDESSVETALLPVVEGRVGLKELAFLAKYWLREFRLVAHWKLDEREGITAHDSTNRYDGTLHKGPLWHAEGGKIGGALQFDGIDDYVSTDFVLNPAAARFSVFAWVKGGAAGQVIISQVSGSGLGRHWLCLDPWEGKLMTELMAPGRLGFWLVSPAVITDGKWHNVGLAWDGSYRHLYVDEIEVAIDSSPLASLESADGGLHFGAGRSPQPANFWSGFIDDIRIYDRAITP